MMGCLPGPVQSLHSCSVTFGGWLLLWRTQGLCGMAGLLWLKSAVSHFWLLPLVDVVAQ
jgi:hypothetical protein